ncbi:MAG: VOC family protein [Planctomycetaceae bacterium]|nr:VOC family protein [Planctomycetaceae bacterium]
MPCINPYLSFNGNCEAAFRFYQSVFGGELELYRFKETPPEEEGGYPIAESEQNRVMHVSLPIGNNVLMGCDTSDVSGPKANFGDNIGLSICAESEEEALRIFNALSAGGQITMPMEKTFWADLFGMLIDQFGVPWMVNYEAGKCCK